MSPSVTDLEPTPVTGPSQGAPYGYCPICGAHGQTRERRPDGYDRCTAGHLYPTGEAVPVQPTPDECRYFRSYGVRHPTLVRRIAAQEVPGGVLKTSVVIDRQVYDRLEVLRLDIPTDKRPDTDTFVQRMLEYALAVRLIKPDMGDD